MEICVFFFDLENFGGAVTRCLPPNEKLVQTLQREGIKISNLETSYNCYITEIYIYRFIYTYIHIFKQIKLSSSFIPHNPAIFSTSHHFRFRPLLSSFRRLAAQELAELRKGHHLPEAPNEPRAPSGIGMRWFTSHQSPTLVERVS